MARLRAHGSDGGGCSKVVFCSHEIVKFLPAVSLFLHCEECLVSLLRQLQEKEMKRQELILRRQQEAQFRAEVGKTYCLAMA